MTGAGVQVIRCFTLIAVGVVAFGARVGLAETADDGLPAGPGHDTFVRVCSACHPPDIVLDKRLSRAGWDEMIQRMIGRGARPTEAEAVEILNYLTASRGTAAAPPTTKSAREVPAEREPMSPMR